MIYRDLEDPDGESGTLNELGTLRRISGDLAGAQELYRRALELARAIASSRDEAGALAGLGRCAVAAGQTGKGEALLRQAYQDFLRFDAHEARELLGELEALSGQAGAGEA